MAERPQIKCSTLVGKSCVEKAESGEAGRPGAVVPATRKAWLKGGSVSARYGKGLTGYGVTNLTTGQPQTTPT